MGHAPSFPISDYLASLPYLLHYRWTQSSHIPHRPPLQSSSSSLEREISRLTSLLTVRQQHATSMLEQIVLLVKADEDRQRDASSSSSASSFSSSSSSAFRHDILELLLSFAEDELHSGDDSVLFTSPPPPLVLSSFYPPPPHLPSLSLPPPPPSSSSTSDESLSLILQKSALDDATKQWLRREFNNDNTNNENQPSSQYRRGRRHRPNPSTSFLPFSTPLSSPPAHPPHPPHHHKLALSQSSLNDFLSSGQSFRDLDDWSFDIFSYSSPSQLVTLACYLFHRFALFSHFQFTPNALFDFMRQVQSHYLTPPYHSFVHAVDTLHCVYLFIIQTQPSALPSLSSSSTSLLSPLDILSLLLAACCHDIGHPGLSNHFLVSSAHPLALLYNDTSVLENMHSSTAFRLLNETALLSSLGRADYAEVRRRMISTILGTDLTHHFEMVGKLDELFAKLEIVENKRKVREEMGREEGGDGGVGIRQLSSERISTKSNAPSSSSSSPSPSPPSSPTSSLSLPDHLLLLSLFLHSADVSNATKPFHLAFQWAGLIQAEFFIQGDQEKKLGLPISPFSDRGKEREQSLEVMQLNFVDFLVAPMWLKMIGMWGKLRECGERIRDNRETWWNRWQERVEREEKEEEEERRGESEEESKLKAEERRLERERRTKERAMLTGRQRRFQETFLLPTPSSSSLTFPVNNIHPSINPSNPPLPHLPESPTLSSTVPIPSSEDFHHQRSPSLFRFPSAPSPHRIQSIPFSTVPSSSSSSSQPTPPSPTLLSTSSAHSLPPLSLSVPLHRRSLSLADIKLALRSALLKPEGGHKQHNRRGTLSAVGITREMMMINDEGGRSGEEGDDEKGEEMKR